MAMRTDTAQPIRLKDYREPDWLVETVALDFSLHPSKTKVRARLALKPNPHAPAAPLSLDGDGLNLVSLKLDGADLPSENYVATPDNLTIAQPPHRPFTLEIETLVDPTANTQLSGLFRSSSTYCTQCEAEGFRRITYFPDRPDVMAVYTTRIEADKAEAPVLLSNGNLDRERRPARTAVTSRSGPIRSRSRRISSPSSAASSPTSRTRSAPCRDAMWCCAFMSSRASRRTAATPWNRSSARCAGTSSGSGANTISTSS